MFDKYTDKVMRMFDQGKMPPSAIDRELGCARGYAHDYIVAWWRAEKEGR